MRERSVVACFPAAGTRIFILFFIYSATPLQAQAAVYLEHDLYTRDHFSMSRTELRAQAAAYHEERDKKTTRARGDWMVMPQPG